MAKILGAVFMRSEATEEKQVYDGAEVLQAPRQAVSRQGSQRKLPYKGSVLGLLALETQVF